MTIEFAPLNIPLERRLQTLAVFLYTQLILTFGLLVIIFSVYALVYTTYVRWLYIAYLIWVYFIDNNTCEIGSRPSKFVRNWRWWFYMADYFPINLVKLPWGEPDPKKNYLLCCFPHGVIPTGAFTVFGTEARGISKVFPNHTVYFNTLHSNFKVPILRELFLSLGKVSASATSLNYILSRPGGGNMSTLVIGGAQEAYYSRPREYTLALKNRKGFAKIALKNGSPLIPVLSFGETDIISQVEFKKGGTFDKFRMKMKSWVGIVPVIPSGRGIFQYSYGILPHRKEINVVVGEPIDVDKVEQPTQEQIDSLHQTFIAKLTEMFETQKKNFIEDSDDIHLEIV